MGPMVPSHVLRTGDGWSRALPPVDGAPSPSFAEHEAPRGLNPKCAAAHWAVETERGWWQVRLRGLFPWLCWKHPRK